jgi:hypothetical protein
MMPFVPISLDRYVAMHLRRNPGTSRREITAQLKHALAAYRRDERCDCGGRIWVIGSAVVGLRCFSCITGEATPEDDYELEEACR